MVTDDPLFGERFSELSNALQEAALLTRQRVVEARTEAAEADQLHSAIVRAVEAARQLRPNGGGQS